ncbi:hypothetical protein HJ134_23035 [Vibrio parahaemolyticus]|nr:hypothetical protein [Vibrio parahaemolyticus]
MIFFCILFSVVIAVVSFVVDYKFDCETYWFTRSGALIALSGALLEYSKLMKLWASSKQNEQSLESVSTRIKKGSGVGLKEVAEESVQTRDFAIRIYNVLTNKDKVDVYALIMAISGTLIWAYGDIPFIFGWL